MTLDSYDAKKEKKRSYLRSDGNEFYPSAIYLPLSHDINQTQSLSG